MPISAPVQTGAFFWIRLVLDSTRLVSSKAGGLRGVLRF